MQIRGVKDVVNDHALRLDPVLTVESFIREQSGEYNKRALLKNLPDTMMLQTFPVIIEFLQDSGKIATDAKGKICWIYNPELVQRYINRNDNKIP